MKIALVRGPYLRPNGIYPWERLNELTKHEVVAFKSRPDRFEAEDLNLPVRSLEWIDGRHQLFGYENFFKRALSKAGLPSDYLRGISELTNEFDIIHTSENFNAFSLQAAIITRNSNTKFIFSTGENIPYPLRQRSPIMWKAKTYVNQQASAITTTTQLGKRALIHEGVNHNKITVIPNCVKPGQFRPSNKPDPEDIGLSSDHGGTINILFVHGLTEQKGAPDLLKAFLQLDNPDIRLILVGSSDLPDNLMRRIDEDQRITWLERVPYTDMPDLYNICDIFTLPSITMVNNEEQFGMAVLEAMACGLPTVVTNVGGLPFVVKEGETSFVVNERSPDDLAKSLEKLVSNPSLREEMGSQAVEYVREKFHPDKVCRDLADFYESL